MFVLFLVISCATDNESMKFNQCLLKEANERRTEITKTTINSLAKKIATICTVKKSINENIKTDSVAVEKATEVLKTFIN